MSSSKSMPSRKVIQRMKAFERKIEGLKKDRRGIIIIITALLLPVLLAFAGLSLDTGRIYDWKRRQKQAAISGAMGGAHEKHRGSSDNDAIDAAKEDTARNNFDDADADITVTVNIPPTSGTHQTAGFVEVIITETVPTYFTRVWGQEEVTVQSRAVAGSIPYADGCVIALDPDDRGALRVQGTATLDADCGIFVNSTHNQALVLNGNPLCISGGDVGIAVSGGVFNPGSPPCVSPKPVQAPPTLDPFAYMSALTPTAGGCDFMNTEIDNGTVTLTPGRYCSTPVVTEVIDPITLVVKTVVTYPETIQISGGTVTFDPGTYFLDSGMRITGNAIVRGTGVTFYTTNISGSGQLDAWKTFVITGTVDFQVTAPTTGDYAGMLFWEDPYAPEFDSDGGKRFHLFAGTADSLFGGALYFPNSEARWQGTGTTADWTQVVANTIRVSGNAVVPGSALNDSDIPVPNRKVTFVE